MILSVDSLSLFRKKILTQAILFETTGKDIYKMVSINLLNQISCKMYNIIYTFLLKSSMINHLDDYYYSNFQHQVKSFLEREISQDFNIIKIFLISILDYKSSSLAKECRDMIFDQAYINVYSFENINEKLNLIKNNIRFFKENLHINTYEQSRETVSNALKCYQDLEYAKNIKDKIIAVSKTLNTWHCNGSLFFEDNSTLPNVIIPFNLKQFEKLSNIPIQKIENELKKLL